MIGLIRIIINSLAAHMHICSKYCKTEGSALQQVRSAQCSQELSEASNGNLGTATLQGSEDNSDFNSTTSTTSTKRSSIVEADIVMFYIFVDMVLFLVRVIVFGFIFFNFLKISLVS